MIVSELCCALEEMIATEFERLKTEG